MENDTKKSKIGSLRLLERRKHPRFLLSHEQFRETKSGRIFPVYDLSLNGLSIKIDQQYWKDGAVIQGILNLHPDSIELSPRLIDYYGDRAALKIEAISTYSRSVLQKALSPKRLGASLQLVKEKLSVADYWFHGVCNTDLLIRLNGTGEIAKAELFFANHYWCWIASQGETQNKAVPVEIGTTTTGFCQSSGPERREDLLLSEEPVKMESLDLCPDTSIDLEKTRWARAILESSPLEVSLKDLLLKKIRKSE